MKLEKYIKANGLRKDWFAAQLGVTPQTLNNWLRGKSEPTLKHKQVIYSLTEGYVTPNDLVELRLDKVSSQRIPRAG